jgi:hypothetical protein
MRCLTSSVSIVRGKASLVTQDVERILGRKPTGNRLVMISSSQTTDTHLQCENERQDSF